MQRLWLAIKAFFLAFKDPKKTQLLLDGPKGPQKYEATDLSHLRLLALLQQSGRLVDFFQEDITSFNDAQVGAAVRKIHQDCKKSLEELITIRPVVDELEGASMTISSGYDPTQFKIVGKIQGGPPFKGVVVHRGWRAHKRSLPKKVGEQANEVIFPAEIEVR